MGGKVNMTDEAKLCSPVHSAFEALVVWCAIRHCHGEELGPLCWPVPAAGLEFLVHLVDVLSVLLSCNGFTRIQKAVVDQMGRRQPNNDHDLFWVQVGFGKCFGASQSSHCTELIIARCLMKSTFYRHHSLRNGLLLCRVREDSSKQLFFICSPLRLQKACQAFLSFLFASNAGQLSLSSVEQTSASMTLWIGACPLAMARHCAPLGQGAHLPLQSFLNHRWHCMSTGSSWAKWTVDVVSCLYCFMNLRKLLEFTFCLASFPRLKKI